MDFEYFCLEFREFVCGFMIVGRYCYVVEKVFFYGLGIFLIGFISGNFYN